MRTFNALGKLIYISPNGIKVKQNKHFRWINFDDHLIQSLIKIKHPEEIILPYIHPLITFAKETSGPSLLLGLGGGTCVHPLLHAPLQVVESSADMIDIAKTYFHLSDHEHLNITCSKAEDYMHQNQMKYQHVLIDLGDQYGYPKACLQHAFFNNCLNSLEQNGDICINFANIEDAKRVNECFKHDFNLKTLCIKMHSNYQIHYSKKLSKPEMLNHFKQHFTIISHTWDSDNGEVLNIQRKNIMNFYGRFLGTIQRYFF
ncbi:MAG: hypothetical protein EBY16_07080 [Gammaproteobacteria bacterium]|nr:hypothetical protein [Gammaproteobacteria bacterium]